MNDAIDWLALVFRWLHFVFGAAWIGTSFYFTWLNNHIREEDDQPSEVAGGLWSVHGGAFYRVIKYKVAPEKLPKILHWFKWEAYLTWVTGVCLLITVYYLNAKVFMVDPGVSSISPVAAVSVGVAALIVSWFVYDLLCRTPLVEKGLAFFALGLVLVAGLAYGLEQVLGPRAAYLHVGASLGTIMAANVFFVIIPNQRVMVDAMLAGREPEAKFGIGAARRSLHNNYFTLPVLFIMISNHFPFTYGHPMAWGLLVGLFVCGAMARHYFNLHGRGIKAPWLLPAAAAGMIGLALVSSPRPRVVRPTAAVGFAEAHGVITRRCLLCHAQTPGHPAFASAPLGFAFDRPDDIERHARAIYETTALHRVMPLANLTGITEEERGVIAAWYEAGAQVFKTEPRAPVAPVPTSTTASGPKAISPPKSHAAWAIYESRCALCHGASGQGDGPASASLNPRPRAFSDPGWQASVDDAGLKKVILEGGVPVGKSPLMPANPDLATQPETVDGLVQIVRSFRP